jgi:hypothetical protein
MKDYKPLEGTYRLVFLVFNTIFNLLTQDDQVRCFQTTLLAARLNSILTVLPELCLDAGPDNNFRGIIA